MNEYLKRNSGGTNTKEIEIFKKHLAVGIELLSPNKQKAMKMYYYDGMKETDIAKELGISKQAVSKKLITSVNEINRNITIMLQFLKSQPKVVD